MLARFVHFWQLLSKDVKPFDWLMWVTEVVVVGLIAYEIWLKERLAARARRKALSKTFDMTFDDGVERKSLPVGPAEVDVNILIGCTIEIGRFGFRFVEKGEKDAVTNASPSVVSVERIAVVRNQNPTSLVSWPDQKGGQYGMWQPHPVHDAEEVLHFKLAVKATRAWAGYLSFKSFDADGRKRFVRRPSEFRLPDA